MCPITLTKAFYLHFTKWIHEINWLRKHSVWHARLKSKCHSHNLFLPLIQYWAERNCKKFQYIWHSEELEKMFCLFTKNNVCIAAGHFSCCLVQKLHVMLTCFWLQLRHAATEEGSSQKVWLNSGHHSWGKQIRDPECGPFETVYGLNVPWFIWRAHTHTHTYTALTCPPLGTCAAGTVGTCGACTCPSRSGRCSCRSTGRFWWRCVGRSPCSPRSSTRCNGNQRPCHRTRCTPRCRASWEQDPSFSSPADHLQTHQKSVGTRVSAVNKLSKTQQTLQ